MSGPLHHSFDHATASVQITPRCMSRVFQFGPLTVFLLFAAAMVSFGRWVGFSLLYYPVFFVVSGKLFASRPIRTGGALDQPSLHKDFFIFAVYAAYCALTVLVIRYLADRRRPSVRGVFRTFAVLIFVTPIVGLTGTLYDVIRYIHVMGITSRRIIAVFACLIGYAAVAAFLAWACDLFRIPPITRRIAFPNPEP